MPEQGQPAALIYDNAMIGCRSEIKVYNSEINYLKRPAVNESAAGRLKILRSMQTSRECL